MAALHPCSSWSGAGLVSLPRFAAPARRRTSMLRRAPAASTSASSEATMEELAGFLEQDLPHLFDEQGIDRSRYEERVEFRDPLTSYNTLTGYLLNIQMLRLLFGPQFFLHLVKQTGPQEITTRWTMRMQFRLLPWKPELLFTGVSVMRVNLETGKFCSHVDLWDSIQNNDFFSLEAAKDVLKQLRFYKTPDLETPKYTVLKRNRCYEVRLYEPFVVVESRSEGVATSQGFNNVTGYIFGNNIDQERIKMTTPVFNERAGKDVDKIQVVIPSAYELSDLPAPTSDAVELREVGRRHAVATKFSGEASDAVVREKEQTLRSAALADGLKLSQGFLLARYNDPDRTPAFLRRNEVLIWLKDFRLEL